MSKFIFVTGGVCSSLGKGVAAASIGSLLECSGLKIAMMKCDPYINVDAGNMNPFQHGEVYVTEDGAFHMTDAYKTNIAAGNYIPACTGMSPYLGCGGIVSYEEPLSGALTVSAKYLKNASIPDESWLNPPEFTWDIRSRAYSGDAVPEWDSLEKQVTNKNYHIKKVKSLPKKNIFYICS